MYFNNRTTQITNKTEKRRQLLFLVFNYVCLNIFLPPVIDIQRDNVIGIKNSVITQVLQKKNKLHMITDELYKEMSVLSIISNPGESGCDTVNQG
jgi:hypothetical protein